MSLESVRVLHEECELLESTMLEVLNAKPRSLRGALVSDLSLTHLSRQSQRHAGRLAGLYEDPTGALQAEGARLSGSDGGDPLALFYSRLGEVRAGVVPPLPPPTHSSAAASGEFAAAAVGGMDATLLPQAVHPLISSLLTSAEASLSGFTPDEVYGKYVDLTGSFGEWGNLPGVREARASAAAGEAVEDATLADWCRTDYLAWLKAMPKAHTSLPLKTRRSHGYKRHLHALLARLLTFFTLKHPLILMEEVVEGWAGAWQGPSGVWAAAAAAVVAGGGAGEGGESLPSSSSHPTSFVPLSHHATQEAMRDALGGGEGVTAQLVARGLKAGGAPGERVARLWAVKDIGEGGVFPKKFLAGVGGGSASAAVATTASSAPLSSASTASSSSTAAAAGGAASVSAVEAILAFPSRYGHGESGGGTAPSAPSSAAAASTGAVMAWWEYLLVKVGSLLEDVIGASRRRVERRSTKTLGEVLVEREAEEADAVHEMGGNATTTTTTTTTSGFGGRDDEDDEETGPIYNPLNLPIDWDGKPIPYWLYRLHGLNQSFKCEICGGETYRGRRDYDRHFQESRHAHGMKLLGIPNTKHFHDVTKIEDARALYATIKGTVEKKVWKPEAEEQFEDSLGNVLDKKTYEALLRQGLL